MTRKPARAGSALVGLLLTTACFVFERGAPESAAPAAPSVAYRDILPEHQRALQAVVGLLAWSVEWQRRHHAREGVYAVRPDTLSARIPPGTTLWLDADDRYAAMAAVRFGAPGAACVFWLGDYPGPLLWGLPRPRRPGDILCGRLPSPMPPDSMRVPADTVPPGPRLPPTPALPTRLGAEGSGAAPEG